MMWLRVYTNWQLLRTIPQMKSTRILHSLGCLVNILASDVVAEGASEVEIGEHEEQEQEMNIAEE